MFGGPFSSARSHNFARIYFGCCTAFHIEPKLKQEARDVRAVAKEGGQLAASGGVSYEAES